MPDDCEHKKLGPVDIKVEDCSPDLVLECSECGPLFEAYEIENSKPKEN